MWQSINNDSVQSTFFPTFTHTRTNYNKSFNLDHFQQLAFNVLILSSHHTAVERVCLFMLWVSQTLSSNKQQPHKGMPLKFEWFPLGGCVGARWSVHSGVFGFCLLSRHWFHCTLCSLVLKSSHESRGFASMLVSKICLGVFV